MAIIDLRILTQQMQQQKYAACYLFVGEESWISDRAYHLVKSKVLVEGLEDFNFNSYYASECDSEDLLEAIETRPVMSSHKLVVVKELQAFNDKAWERLAAVKIPAYCVLVLLGTQIDKRKKSVKKVFDQATVIECKTPYDNQKRAWLEALAQEEGLRLSNEALNFWESQWNFSLNQTALELRKIKSFLAGAERQVSLADLQVLLPQFSEESIFKFTEAVGYQNFAKARTILQNLLTSGESEIAFLQLLARHTRILLKVHLGLHRGLKAQALASFIGVSPYFLTPYTEQARLWSYENLKRWLVKLSYLDSQLKSSRLGALVHWESVLLDFQEMAEINR